MKNYLVILVAFLLAFSIDSNAQTAPNEHDTQVWSDASLTFPIYKQKDKDGKKNEKLSGFISGDIRFGQNVRHFTDERIGFGLNYMLNKTFSLTTAYLYRAGQPTKNKKEYEHRVRFDLNIERKWKYFSLKDRNRIEQRIRHSKDDTTRYRNKLQLKIPVKNSRGDELIAPFVAGEMYFDFRQDAWFRNEYSFGVSRKITDTAAADVFYMIQSNKNTTVLKRLDVIGVSLKFKIK